MRAELQSVRFDAEKFTAAEARAWLTDHDLKTAIEEAALARKGTVVKASEEFQNITIVVMEPGRLDTADEWATEETIAKAMQDFMKAPEFCIDHGTPDKPAEKAEGHVVESFLTDRALSEFRGQKVDPPLRKGTWISTFHLSKAPQWAIAKQGGITGGSIEGHPEEGDGYERVPGSRPPG